MAYFSNGTEGMAYEHNVCKRCVHYPKGEDDRYCTVWELHVMWQSDRNSHDLLDQLIPRTDGDNQLCTMFYGKEQAQ